MIRAIIVDDESPARREMRRLLAGHEDVEILGDFATPSESLAALAAKPDLVFLDIQMPGESGLDAATRLASSGASIVFVTAYHQHALQAFELAAFDYLLKPVEKERLAKTLDRFRSGLPAEAADDDPPWKEGDRIFLRNTDRSWFIPLTEIRLLESDGSHTRVHFGSERPLIGRSLSAFGKRLPGTIFFQANRSQIVNLTSVRSTEEWFAGTLKATLECGATVEFSRRQTRLFREVFGL